MFELVFVRCLKPTCANDTEFNEWIKKITISEVFISSYFDISDYETPVHYFLDDTYVSLVSEKCVIMDTYFKKSFLKLYDKLFSLFSEPVQDYFYSLSNKVY